MRQERLGIVDADLPHLRQHFRPGRELGRRLDVHDADYVDDAARRGLEAVLRA